MKITVTDGVERTAEQIKIERLRHNMPGYIFGEKLTPYATDQEVLEICELKDRIAELHNRAFSRLGFGDVQA